MISEASSQQSVPRALAYVVGIDIGMESCLMCALTTEKRQVIKPSQFSNDAPGFQRLFERLERLGTSPEEILYQFTSYNGLLWSQQPVKGN
jgi:hypothetical protein